MQVVRSFNKLGEAGLVELPQYAGIAPRVFRIINGDCLEYMPRDDWHNLGWARGRAYGHAAKSSALQIVE